MNDQRYLNDRDDPSLFDGQNPFEGGRDVSRAVAWERASFKTHYGAEQKKIQAERDQTRVDLAAALSVGSSDEEAARIQRYTWPQLLTYAGWLKGKASVPLPPIQVTQPAAQRRRKSK